MNIISFSSSCMCISIMTIGIRIIVIRPPSRPSRGLPREAQRKLSAELPLLLLLLSVSLLC